jgi:hypothetical protein
MAANLDEQADYTSSELYLSAGLDPHPSCTNIYMGMYGNPSVRQG